MTYAVVVTNKGPLPATRATVTYAIPSNAEFVGASKYAGTETITRIGNSIVAALKDLPAGAEAAFALTLRPTAEGSLVNTVVASGNEVDPVPSNNTVTVSTPVRNLPGVLQFHQPTFTVSEDGGQAVIQIDRASGNKGVVAVYVETVPGGTAVPNVDYTPTGTTLIFQEGESSKTFTVPIKRDGIVTGDKTIDMRLVNINFGQLGSPSTATLQVIEADYDRQGPRVTQVSTIGNAQAVNGVILTFDEALDPTSALNPANYGLLASAALGLPGGVVPISQVFYNASIRAVWLVPSRALPAGAFHQVILDGTSASGVADVFGNKLDGDGNGVPGGNFLASFARGTNLSYRDNNSDLVNLRLSGSGTIDSVLNASGAALSTSVIGADPMRSVLSGSVRRTSLGGDGVTSLGALTGVGSFGGGAYSRLTSPPFYATNGPLPSAASARQLSTGSPFVTRRARVTF